MTELAPELIVILVLLLLLVIVLFILIRPTRQRNHPKTGQRPHPFTQRTPPSLLTPSTTDGQQSASVQRFVLHAVAGSLTGRQFPIPATGLRIGRNPDNDVVLTEAMVSRQHALIQPTSGGYVIYDRNSVNGVFVDGFRAFEKLLQPGNRIQIGLAEFVFLPEGALIPSTPSNSSISSPMVDQGYATFPATRHLDDYRIEGLIGGGGMSEVYRARAPDGRPVAIKIPRVTSDTYLLRKFEKEGNRIGALLRGHPHIVRIEQFGYSREGIPYIVMEYVEGGSLRDRIRQGMSEEEIRRIIGQTCLALSFAHSYSIVHRDIKPENILLTRTGNVKVADFGIAKELSGVTVTYKGPVGTPEYMSPEQAQGENVVPASDIYSVGVVTYELATGQVPFPRRPEITDDLKQALDVVERHIQEIPRPPRELRPQISTGLENFIMKALEKDPRKRFRNGQEAARALGCDKDMVPKPKSAPTAKLVIVEGPHQGRILPLTNDTVEVGRADIDPENTLISRRHIILRRRGDDFWIEDISANGTWVNRQRLSVEQLVTAGDSIRIGNSVLRLEL